MGDLLLNCDGKNKLCKMLVEQGPQLEPTPRKCILIGDLSGGEWSLREGWKDEGSLMDQSADSAARGPAWGQVPQLYCLVAGDNLGQAALSPFTTGGVGSCMPLRGVLS